MKLASLVNELEKMGKKMQKDAKKKSFELAEKEIYATSEMKKIFICL